MRTATPTFSDELLRVGAPSSIALVDAGPEGAAGGRAAVTYGELRAAVADRRDALALAERSVVVLTGSNSLDWIVTYLALLAHGHVPLLASGHVERLVAHWSPGAVVTADARGWSLERLTTTESRAPRHVDLHPDLALLMSTSGSTGSPKLVRLSAANLLANATSIVEFQRLTDADRAVTTLPLHYSFGLSVLHSHLVAGAGVVVTDRSVVEPEVAAALRDHGITNVAGVPHTYELLEQAGPERLRVDTLRFLAQAGGRMEPDRVAAWANRAHEWGAEWFTMYGQTEATARMSYVPPNLVRDHPGTIGIAIPGGHFSLEPLDESSAMEAGGVGEIVYRGPNVMLGYATDVDDLARGAEVDALHTGDLGRIDPATGLLEVVGRRSRRIKPFGLRLDLDDLERRLALAGFEARVAGDDEVVAVAGTNGTTGGPALARAVTEITALPESRVLVTSGPPPINANGKVDYAGLLATARTQGQGRPGAAVPGSGDEPAAGDRLAAVVEVVAEVFGRADIDPSESFVSLGGDSLSYVECSIRFERILGPLPPEWHLRPLTELARPRRPRRFARIDTTILLRSVGILAVVSTHMWLWHVPGGAHLMLGVVGYNVARFLLPTDPGPQRLRAGLRTVARVAVPTVLWTLAFMVVGQYTWTTLTLANNYIGPSSHQGNHWHFWFIEVFVHLVAATTLLTAIPAVRRIDVRWPYAFPLALLGLTLVLRMDWADLGDWYNMRFRTHSVAWFFVLGWLVQRSTTRPQQLATTVLCLATAPGVFDNPHRELFIAFGLVLLVWFKAVPVPRFAVRPLATLAEASMWIFISHFMIWPPMKDWFVVEVAYPLTILASVGVWWMFTRAPRLIRTRLARTVGSGANRRWLRRFAGGAFSGRPAMAMGSPAEPSGASLRSNLRYDRRPVVGHLDATS